jgi:hypothetical protein
MQNFQKKANKILRSSAACVTALFLHLQANAGLVDQIPIFQAIIKERSNLQRSIMRNITTETYGRCQALGVRLLIDEGNGSKLPEDVQTGFGLLIASLMHYKAAQAQMGNSGISPRVLDELSGKFTQDAKRNPDLFFKNNGQICVAVINKLTSDIR